MKVKKILLFKHISICNNLFNSLNDSIIVELDKRGIEYTFIDITGSPNKVEEEMLAKLDKSFDAVLAFNETYYHNLKLEDGENIFDRYHIPFYNWIVDHPLGISEYFNTSCRNYNVLCMDRQHVEFVKRYRPEIKSVSFLPLGGMGADRNRIISLKERKYDVAFPGGFLPKTLEETLDEYNRLQEPNREIILNLIDYLMENRDQEVTIALDTVLKERFGIDCLDEANYDIALDLAASANDFMRSYFREEVIRTLIYANIDFHIFGNGWRERVGMGSGKTTFHDGVSFNETGSIFANTKILLNVMPCFKDGMHDRIASGMLHNTLVMTDHSKYLDELPNNIMGFYSIDDVSELPVLLKGLLCDIDKAQIIADNGYEYALKHFSWEKTIDALLAIMEQEDNNA